MSKCKKTISGIYIIKNKINHRFYIGSSKNCLERKRSHFRELKYGKHKNKFLLNEFNKFKTEMQITEPEEIFDFFIINYCDIKKLKNKEQYYIDKNYDKQKCAII